MNHQKDFDEWNRQKKEIDENASRRFYHPREIWWCSLGANIGFEENGSGEEYRRPVLIYKGMSRQTCLAIPLTTSQQSHKMRPSVGKVDGKEARAILSQMRVVDTKRLVRKIEYLDKDRFEEIRNAVRGLL